MYTEIVKNAFLISPTSATLPCIFHKPENTLQKAGGLKMACKQSFSEIPFLPSFTEASYTILNFLVSTTLDFWQLDEANNELCTPLQFRYPFNDPQS